MYVFESRYKLKEDEDLTYIINALRDKLWNAIVEANYNLLDEKVQSISREIDEMLLKILGSDR